VQVRQRVGGVGECRQSLRCESIAFTGHRQSERG